VSFSHSSRSSFVQSDPGAFGQLFPGGRLVIALESIVGRLRARMQGVSGASRASAVASGRITAKQTAGLAAAAETFCMRGASEPAVRLLGFFFPTARASSCAARIVSAEAASVSAP
jgi:hypothetical protein